MAAQVHFFDVFFKKDPHRNAVEPSGLLMSSEGIEREHWHEMD